MKIIRPQTIDAAVLSASSAVDTVPEWDAATTYASGDRVRSDVTHRIYESLVEDNTGIDPVGDIAANWLDVAPTNAWAMFDAFNQTQTESDGAIEVTLTPVGIVDAMALLNLDAASVSVTVSDAVAGEIYARSFDLVADENVGADFYAWCFEPIIRRSALHIEGLPVYADATIAVTIAADGDRARCGNLIIGRQRELGATVWGYGFGIIDRSRKDEDDFGNITIVERPYRDTGTFEVIVRRSMVDEVGRQLRLHRARPIVYIGSGIHASAIYYGFFRDFRLNAENLAEAKLTIEIEGLT